MANKPFKDITDRDLFAGLIVAAFGSSEADKPMGVHDSRAVQAVGRPSHCGAQVPVGKPSSTPCVAAARTT